MVANDDLMRTIPSLGNIDQPQPLARQAYDLLRASIISGELRGGQIYNEQALAKALGVSRTPVREALLELSAQGLVQFLPRRGVLVTEYTRRDVEDGFEVREALETYAAARLASLDPPPNLDCLEQCIERHSAALRDGDRMELIMADREFHLDLCQLTGNRRFTDTFEKLRDLIQVMSLGVMIRDGREEVVIEEHRMIVAAIRERNPRAARNAIRIHLQKSKDVVLENFGRASSSGIPRSDNPDQPRETDEDEPSALE